MGTTLEHRRPRLGRKAVGWVIWAMCAGLWLGMTARIAMRVLAVQSGVAPGFSLGGSLEVVVFGVMLGTPTALVFWACRRKWALPAWSGTVSGLLLLAVLIAIPPPAARSALSATSASPLTTILTFAAAFASYGTLLDLLWRWRQRAIA